MCKIFLAYYRYQNITRVEAAKVYRVDAASILQDGHCKHAKKLTIINNTAASNWLT
jgi:hypothetical protein